MKKKHVGVLKKHVKVFKKKKGTCLNMETLRVSFELVAETNLISFAVSISMFILMGSLGLYPGTVTINPADFDPL